MPRLGLIDVGSNTLRLVVGEDDASGGTARFLFQEVIATRLGEGLAPGGSLKPEAIARTVKALEALRKKALDRFQVDFVEAYATAWARAASNTSTVLSEAARLDLPIWILTAREESRMALEAARLMPHERLDWVLDIGGGSTEIIRAGGGFFESVPWGAVSVTERFENLEEARAEMKKVFHERVSQAVSTPGSPAPGNPPITVLGGTAAALAGLKVGIPPRAREFFQKAQGILLEAGWMSETLGKLCGLDLESRRKIPGMEVERADILPGGTVLLLAFLEAVGGDGIRVCLYSFAHGLLAERLEGLKQASRSWPRS